MEELLTKERALELHRMMWEDMRDELGDNPLFHHRSLFKKDWCREHNFKDVDCSCFLCEYTTQQGEWCGNCPLDWSSLRITKDQDTIACCTDTYKNGMGLIYEVAPISEILALPEVEEGTIND